MPFSRELTAQLDVLTAALDEPGADLETILDVLVDQLAAAVSSFLGLRMTLQLGECPITLTVVNQGPALAAGTSFTLPLGRLIDGIPRSTMVFYARNPGAFVDLATDLQRVRELDGPIFLDDPLPSAFDQPLESGITGLAELSAVNQAIGVLITRGHTPNEAMAELRHRAAAAQHSVPNAALHVLASHNLRRLLPVGDGWKGRR